MSTSLIISLITAIVLIPISIGIYLAHIKKNTGRQLTLFPKKQSTSLFQSLSNRQEVSIKLQEKLINMVGGDREEAERLVAKARFATHGKSETYYWWKAIQDLEHKRQKNEQ
jgi:hypothetical protein